MGEKASVTLLCVALGLFEPVSAAWAKKDKVEVTLTAPAAGALYHAPAGITLSAIVRTRQKNPPIVKVEFFQGTKLIGTVRGPRARNQYTLNWTGVAAGRYTLVAKATNDKGNTDLSEPVSITVNAVPSVSIMTPGNNTIFAAPATFTVTASASDSDGSIAKVEFYDGAKLVGAATSAPYSVTLSNTAAGFLNLKATATDNRGASATSAPVSVIVNSLPSVSLTSPTSNASFKAPANIPLAVRVADTDGSVANVEYFDGTTLIISLSAPPYSFIWTEVPQGSYALTAHVTDNLGGVMTSAAANVTVNAAGVKLYYIHVDHLNTPRLVADGNGTTVWRWDQQEPFGATPSNDDPYGDGVRFEFSLRSPGQYLDRETGLAYNIMRDYDSGNGRYVQSDPIGLGGGLNTYAYASGNPISYTDPTGLETYQCRRPLGGLPGDNQRSGPDIWGNPFYHQYSCTRNAKGKLVCGGQGFSESWWSSPGKPTTSATDYYSADACKRTQGDNKCFELCLINEWKKPRPHYGIPFGTDCQEYDEDVNLRCREKCGLK